MQNICTNGTFFAFCRILENMKSIVALIFLVFSMLVHAQTNLSGKWQGIMVRDGYTNEKAFVIYANFEISDGKINGRIRNDQQDLNVYCIKRLRGDLKQNSIKISEFVVEKKVPTVSKASWCLVNMELTFNDSTGYLSGKYTSTDCKRNNGTVILFRDKSDLKPMEESSISHQWLKPFLYNLKKGYNAPEILEKERESFVFKPVYFDYDKDVLKSEYYPFLLSMIRIIESHSDLRIKITGHTDSDGSDQYNDDLSKRRAEALINFFVSNGLSRDRLVLDFKGEKQPIDSNNTEDGKQKNRRVDFSFI